MLFRDGSGDVREQACAVECLDLDRGQEPWLSFGDQCTATTRSGSDWTRCWMFTQSVRCTDTPLPLVTKPVILSPGTGVQHFDSRAQTSAAPSTDHARVTGT